MTSKQQSTQPSQPSQPPNTGQQSLDDIVEVGHEDESDIEVEDITDQQEPEPEGQQSSLPDRTKAKSPAYVAPIPKIGSIPKISPAISLSPERPKLPPFVGSFLMGKTVDEYGDIIDEQTGQVLARAGGDLPEIVGRKVSNRDGDILGDNGELLGYVADIEIERKGSTSPQSPRTEAQPRSLLDMMRKANASLMVDHLGNILDPAGNVVGKFHDNNNPLHRKEKEQQELRERIQQQSAAGPSSVRKKKQNKRSEREENKEGQEDGVAEEQEEHPSPPPKSPKREQQKQSQSREQEQPRPPRRTEEERRQNAESWRKENPSDSPSDIFLDVKSTKEGIQLTIRIPTVFGGQQIKPNISFS
ncbi:hypothetical protein QBC40DRAFT_66282 [Triangularia verruculosa]|uniref:Uncharacterized protein n=1 Tax=Triangularia verruculosa TaxID=2587418 RepID=A0AAN6XWU6_9PEZI|nr:hypothetical protein QBC40DRAFT_66282 [Triangularia verruculosa]